MRTVDRFSVLSVALLTFGSFDIALGDSIDEALNRFHIENMMGQITSDISSEVSSSAEAFRCSILSIRLSDHTTADSFSGLTIAAWETVNDRNAWLVPLNLFEGSKPQLQ